MVTIIIISNDSHVMMLKERFQPLIKGQICIYTDFEQGLMAVFDKRPVSVFIQREINGTAAEVIARQIKGLLREGSPRIILMGSLAGTAPDGAKCFDDSFDFATTEAELCTFFEAQLRKIPFLLWNDDNGREEWSAGMNDFQAPPEKVSPATVAGSSTAQDSFEMNCQDNLSDHEHISTLQPQFSREEANPQESIPLTIDNPPSADIPTFNLSSDATIKHSIGTNITESPKKADSPPILEPFKVETDTRASADEQSAQIQSQSYMDDFSSFGLDVKVVNRNSRSRVYLAGALVVVVLGAAMYMTDALSRFTTAKPAPVQVAAPQIREYSTVTRNGLISLPEIIPRNGVDSQYSVSHPGWSRFVSERMEFLVFNEGGSIKAIQLLATGGEGISGEFLLTLVEQAVGSKAYSITGAKISNDYQEQHASLAGGGEMVIYRKKSNGQVRGAVVSLP